MYEGTLWAGKPHGWGTYVGPDGARYEGESRDGYFHGRIAITDPNGDSRTCEYDEGSELSCTGD